MSNINIKITSFLKENIKSSESKVETLLNQYNEKKEKYNSAAMKLTAYEIVMGYLDLSDDEIIDLIQEKTANSDYKKLELSIYNEIRLLENMRSDYYNIDRKDNAS